ncbi:MAG: hypothetical protein EBZ47_03265 [Chlamydiae bacterium]|nr:hypothetical protein [Chlamydiota bacterium]
MYKKYLLIAAFFISFSSWCEAGSVRLFNDSSFRLRAVIRGADGSYQGEMVVNPQTSSIWSDSLQRYGYTDDYNNRFKSRSVTPYTIIWYCMDGSDFSFSDNVASGAYVQAQHGTGKKSCSASKSKEIFKPGEEENLSPAPSTPQGGSK